MSLPNKLCFVDIETTGMRPNYDRIIEIGILRVEGGQVVQTFQSLVNPQISLPPEIMSLTGITGADLENAPSFWEVKREIKEILQDAYFVAHNVRFDYSFLKNEFRRMEESFSSKHFCTVKLSRTLFPRFKHHNLDSLIERFSLECEKRHRAFDDAKILWDFYQIINKKFKQEKIIKALDIIQKRPSMPINLSQDILDSLPEGVGVYIFYGKNGAPLYVGKSINIRARVLSHFSSDHASSKEMKISQQVESIETKVTSGELGALLLESSLVKKMQPLYNRKLRNSQKLVVLKESQNEGGFKTIDLEIVNTISLEDISKVVGVFRSKSSAKQYLVSVCKERSLCEKLLGLEKSKGECFGYRLGRCRGACAGGENVMKYNLRMLEAFISNKIRPWPFKGPVLIKEKTPFEEKEEVFMVDKWCYLGNMESDQGEYLFDVDTYKILERYIKSKDNMKNIHLI